METNEIIVTEIMCAAGFLATFLNTATSAHPNPWVRRAKFLPMVGFVVVAVGIIALKRPSFVTLWILFASWVASLLAEFVDTALSSRTSEQTWELFKSRLKHWPYAVTIFALIIIAALFMTPRTRSKTETKTTQITTAEEKQARDEQRELDKIPR